MILDVKKTSVAYRCPDCGAGVVSVVGIFSLTGDMFKIKCSCGKSELILSRSDDRINLSVPCLLCPKPHHFTVSKSVFFANELFCLPCPYSGLDACFIGDHDRVLNALAESEEMLAGILTDAGVDDLDMLREGDPDVMFDDPAIDEIIRFMLVELSDEGSLHCGCKEGDIARYGYEFAPPDYESVRIFCQTCGCEKLIPMSSTIQANAFLHADSLILEPKK